MARARESLWLCGLAALALANGGCVAVVAGAAAASGAGGYAYYKGRVTRVYAAGLDDVWAATKTSLGELGFPLVREERPALTLESRTASGDRIQVTFEVQPSPIPAEGSLTRVGVRVATFGDETVSTRILNQIDRHLARAPATPPPPLPAPGAPAARPSGPVTLSPPVESPPPPVAEPKK